MNSIAFVLATREFFVLADGQAPQAGTAGSDRQAAAPRLLRELRQLGWPAEAELVGAQAAELGGRASGVLVELIDAFPLLAAPTDEPDEGPALSAYRQLARLALDLVGAGALLPRLRARGGGRLGWEARWRAHIASPAQRVAVARTIQALPALAAVPTGGSWAPRASALTSQRLAYQVLDACADVLVREASRRGALVRLGSWPAGAWEQQLVRALGEDRAVFSCPEALDAEVVGREVNAWVEDQLEAAALSLLPSPAMWQAPETLAQVMRRLLAPAAQLALTLRSGRPAPRMLPPLTTAPPPRRGIPAAATQAAARAVSVIASAAAQGPGPHRAAA
jgi:hypothetical protein